MGVKKKFFLGWLAFEALGLLIAIPAGGQIVDKVMFSAAPRTAFAAMPSAPGKAGFIVASNAPFSILSEGVVGDMHINIIVSGNVGGKIFGAKAQNPGEPISCVTALSAAPSKIYTAHRKTAVKRGHVLDQSVVIEISYDPELSPVFRLETLDKPSAVSAMAAPACLQHST